MAKRKVSAPRLGRPYRIERSGLSPEAWPDAEPWGPAVSLARAAVERRQASAPAKRALRRQVQQLVTRLSAFCLLFCSSLCWQWRREANKVPIDENGTLVFSTRSARQKIAGWEWERLFTSPRVRGEVVRAKRGGGGGAAAILSVRGQAETL